MEVDIPASVAYKCYSDREAIPKWMPFISSVKVSNLLMLLTLKHHHVPLKNHFSYMVREGNLQLYLLISGAKSVSLENRFVMQVSYVG